MKKGRGNDKQGYKVVFDGTDWCVYWYDHSDHLLEPQGKLIAVADDEHEAERLARRYTDDMRQDMEGA